MKRRDFMKNAAFTGGATALGRYSGINVPKSDDSQLSSDTLPKWGPKHVVKNKEAVCSSDHPLVTETMLQVMKDGGNAVDAAVAGSLMNAAIEPHLTNFAGTVTFLYWEAKTGKSYQLESTGTLVSGLPPFRPVPEMDPYGSPMACIPGFMPGLGEMHRKFGTKPWSYLCQPAYKGTSEGHFMNCFEFGVLSRDLPFITYFPSGREHYTPDGFLPQVGERIKNPELAETIKRLAEEGPEYCTKGDWAKHFVKEANRIGWPIKMKHMTEIPPQWLEPLRYKHNGFELLQLSPPEWVGIQSAIVLGVLSNFDLKSMGHYTESAESLYLLAHALRWSLWEVGFINDPKLFHVPVEEWLSGKYHSMIASILKKSMPKIDLSEHVRLISGKPALAAAGLPTAGPGEDPPHQGSCELSIVDTEGNWVQMMNTLQSGGIPGLVIDGVPMIGSHAGFHMNSGMTGWLTGRGRIGECLGNTIVLKGGKPWLSLGTPGNVHITIPQVLLNILDYGMDPYEASVAPRMYALRDDYVLEIESRIPQPVVAGLAKLGIRVKPLPAYDWHMGSFQISWRDEKTGLLNSSADPRRTGQAGGF